MTPSALLPAIEAADERIRPLVRETPLEFSPALSERAGREIHLKLENYQVTGSFKARGALNATLLTEGDVVTASSGNHGAALAWACGRAGRRALVFVPETAPATKIDAIRRHGAEVRVHGTDGLDTEFFARELAKQEGLHYISPYNDARVVAGQGTVGAEIARQIDQLEELWIAVGGGGLISGTATFLRSRFPRLRVFGCSPSNSKVMAESVRAGSLLELPSEPTLSDGTAGGIEPDAITFPLCRELVDEWELVDESEIADAIRLMLEVHHMVVEGAAAVAIAAALRKRSTASRAAIVVCGANIGSGALRGVMESAS